MGMRIKPNEPPGHARRKLRAVVDEIQRLRNEGYTIRAIRQALEDAGVKVAWSTVQREAARLATPSPTEKLEPKARRDQITAPKQTNKETASLSHATTADVDSFFDEHNTNPLFKRRKKGKQP